MGKYRSHSHAASSEPLPNTTESLSSAAAGCGRAHPPESHGGDLPGGDLAKGKEEEVPHMALLSTGPRVQQTWLLFVSVIKSLSEFCRALSQLYKRHQATPPGKGVGDGEVQNSRDTVKRQVCLLKRPLHWKCYEVINFVLIMKSSQYNGPGRGPSK